MKKAIAYWFLFLIALLTFSVFFVSCGKKPKPSKTETITETKLVVDVEKQILNEKLIKSLAVIDSLKAKVPVLVTGSKDVDCDSLCNNKFIEYLKTLNFNKKSGNNETGFYFDATNRMFVAYSKLGETIDHLKDSISIKNKLIASLKDKETTKTIPEAYVPKWIQYLAGFGALCLAIIAVCIIIKLKSKIPV